MGGWGERWDRIVSSIHSFLMVGQDRSQRDCSCVHCWWMDGTSKFLLRVFSLCDNSRSWSCRSCENDWVSSWIRCLVRTFLESWWECSRQWTCSVSPSGTVLSASRFDSRNASGRVIRSIYDDRDSNSNSYLELDAVMRCGGTVPPDDHRGGFFG